MVCQILSDSAQPSAQMPYPRGPNTIISRSVMFRSTADVWWFKCFFRSTATQKFSESGGNQRFLYAVSEMQGWRISESFAILIAFAAHLLDALTG